MIVKGFSNSLIQEEHDDNAALGRTSGVQSYEMIQSTYCSLMHQYIYDL